MEPLRQIRSLVIPIGGDNIDTDTILPGRHLKVLSKKGLGRYAFESLRYDQDGEKKSGFILNRPDLEGAQIIVSGENFGCGSSREHAAWALADLGVRVVIARSFGDIFYGNAVKNGILPIALNAEVIDALSGEKGKIVVDLDRKIVTLSRGDEYSFSIDEFSRHRLLHGLDEIALTERFAADIADYELKMKRLWPWVSV